MFSHKHFPTFAWGVLAYNILVVLWGAVVRATGSGAGCGSHWPLCNSVVVPNDPQIETLIELSHRLTSGIAGILVIVLLVWAFHAYPRQHRVRLGAGLSLLFIITEGLVGAGIVLLRHVADNPSTARIFSISGHLVNTFILLGVLTLTAWWASGGAALRLRGQGMVGAMLWLGIVGTLLIGTTGAITALAGTLFPVTSIAQGLQQDLSSTAHPAVRLAIVHPLLAVSVGVFLVWMSNWVRMQRPSPVTSRLAWAMTVMFGLQIVGGLVNVVLHAPVWMQLVHLLMADALWIILVLLAASALATTPPMPVAAVAPKSALTAQ